MRIQYNGKSKILIRLTELVNQKVDAEDMEQTAADLQKEIDEKADKSAIPTVGDGVLSVQRNGKSVGTFSANAAGNASINIPVPEKVSELENDAGYGTYTKPTTGIPKSDLASGVQASLGKADTALQKHQDISGKLDKTGDASNTTVAFSAASARENVKTDEKLSVIVGKIAKWLADLKTVAFTGSYNDLANKPTIPDVSGKQDKLTAGTNITISGNTISAKDTTYTSKSAVSGGTDVSLVTTGEKAIWNAKTSNVGTITGIKMNGASKGTSGVVDLGTVITAHQDISGKQDKSTAVTHSANTAVGSMAKPVYIAADGKATPITHSINADVPANAKFTDTTYNDATQSTHGLMTAADKKKLDGMDLSKYLPKSGGVMTGDIDMQANQKEILIGTQKAKSSDGTAVAGGILEKHANMTSSLPEIRSFIGSFHNTDTDSFYSVISVRHRNGCTDGNAYGMYLYSVLNSVDSLRWNKQIAANVWQGDRTLLDSINYSNYAAPLSHTHKNIDSIGNVGYYGSDAASTNGWDKFYSGTLTGYNDRTARLMLTYMYGYNNFGTIFFHARCNNGNTIQIQRLLWEVRSGFEDGDVVAVAKGNDYSLYVYNRNPQWGRIKIRVLESGGTSSAWDMTLASNFTKESTAPTPTIVASDGCTVANATTWNGLINDVDTYNSSDTWILVKKDNRIQHRYAGELDVNSAKTLVDSGWIATTRNTSFTATSTVKCRKYGQLVEVRGEVTFSNTYGSPTVCTLPAGYCPATVVQTCGYTPSGKIFGIKVDTAGVVSFSSDAAGTFVKSTTYRIDLTYLLG